MSDDTFITDEEIKRYNAKISRYSKVPTDYLPEKLSRASIEKMDAQKQKELKEDIADFLRQDSLRIDKASGATKYFKRLYTKLFEELEAKKAEMADRLDSSTEKGTMGAINKLNLSPRQNRFDKMSQKERMKSLQGIMSQLNKNPDDYKASYIEAMKTMFGEGSLEYDLIKPIIEKISGEELYLLYGEDADLQIDVIYNKGLSADVKAGLILDALYEHGYIDEKPDYISDLTRRIKEMYGISDVDLYE